jgi:hypothetical protein
MRQNGFWYATIMVDNCNDGGYVSIWLDDTTILKRFAYIIQRSSPSHEWSILLSFRRLICNYKTSNPTVESFERTCWLLPRFCDFGG